MKYISSGGLSGYIRHMYDTRDAIEEERRAVLWGATFNSTLNNNEMNMLQQQQHQKHL